jgi:hypothetical protein
MAPKPVILAIAGIGAVFGLSILITASVVLSDDLFKSEVADFCDYSVDPISTKLCDAIDFWKGACALGIIAGIFQIASFGAAFLDKAKIWCGINIFACVLCVIAFGLSVSKYAFHNPKINGFEIPLDMPSKFKAFAVISLLDALFAIGGAIGVFKLGK